MAELFIQRPNGESFIIERDGSITYPVNKIELDWCDKCEKWKELEGGHYVQMEGIKIVCFCQACK